MEKFDQYHAAVMLLAELLECQKQICYLTKRILEEGVSEKELFELLDIKNIVNF